MKIDFFNEPIHSIKRKYPAKTGPAVIRNIQVSGYHANTIFWYVKHIPIDGRRFRTTYHRYADIPERGMGEKNRNIIKYNHTMRPGDVSMGLTIARLHNLKHHG